MNNTPQGEEFRKQALAVVEITSTSPVEWYCASAFPSKALHESSGTGTAP